MRARIVTVLALALASIGGLPVRAQETPAGEIDLQLVAQRLSHGPGDPLGLRLRVTNRSSVGLDGFRLSVAAYDRIQTRSDLEQSLDVDPFQQVPASLFPKDVTTALAPGDSTTITIDDPIDTLVTFASATASGVYPLSISLLDPAGLTALTTVTTHVIFYPTPPETPLNLVPVVPVNVLPSRTPGGAFVAPDDPGGSLESAAAPGGWLDGLVEALEKAADAGLRFGFAPTPMIVDELEDMADGFERVEGPAQPASSDAARAAESMLARIQTLTQARGVQPVLVPYAFPDLPTLAADRFEELAQQLARGARVLASLGVDRAPSWVFAPAGRMDAATIDRLLTTTRTAAARSFFSDTVLDPPPDPGLAGCPSGSPTFACPVVVTSGEGRAVGYATDPVLQERLSLLSDTGNGRLELQHFFAETAMIREELPGIEGRVVHVTIPSLWHPDPRLARLLFSGLARAPWLTTLTPSRGLDLSVAPAARSLMDPLPPAPLDPGADHYASADDAGMRLDEFRTIEPPESLVERLERNVLVAYSRNFWGDPGVAARGRAFAEESIEEIDRHLANISVFGAPEITMTSRRGEIQVLVSNDNSYPVRVAVRLTSPDLDIESDGVIVEEFPPNKTTPVVLSATAQVSGIFPVEIRLETPSGGTTIFGPESISIRSTELNRVALGLTLGALAFLVLFYVVRAVRRSRPEDDLAASGSSE